MAKQKFVLELRGSAVIELDDSVIAAVDDEWRSTFYNLDTPAEIAAHIGYNILINRWGLSKLDGFADLPETGAKIVGVPEWDVEAEEVE